MNAARAASRPRRGGRFVVAARSRSWALTLLYAWDVGGGREGVAGEATPLEHARGTLLHHRMAPRYRPLVERLLSCVGEHLADIDATIARHSDNWRLERMHAIDRNILRISIAELWFARPRVPAAFVIKEALRLGELYGTDESPRFLNGVLDAARRAAEAPR